MVLIWQDILGVARVGVRDNFFEIGGHSLRATVLVSRIHKELGCSISLREVFQSPTVESLAQLVKKHIPTMYESIPQATESEAYPVSSAQKRLYVLRQMDGESSATICQGSSQWMDRWIARGWSLRSRH
uniref:Phosphopantetheine-binding protein n=1 Tax=Paenibacillus polymyxa TaxID=1406 RepID=A0AAE9PYZ1_PAEPO